MGVGGYRGFRFSLPRCCRFQAPGTIAEKFPTLHPQNFLRHFYYQVSHIETNVSQVRLMGGSEQPISN